MTPRHVALITGSLVVISLAVAIVFVAGASRASLASSRADTPTIGGHAAPEVTFERLVKNSDLVVLGEVTSRQVGIAPCCERFAGRLSPSMPAPVRRVDTLRVNVQESLWGKNSPEVTIKVQRPGGNVIQSGDAELALLEFEVGQTYLLFLVDREDHHLIQGVSRGRWTANEGVFVQTATGVKYDQETLHERLASYRR